MANSYVPPPDTPDPVPQPKDKVKDEEDAAGTSSSAGPAKGQRKKKGKGKASQASTQLKQALTSGSEKPALTTKLHDKMVDSVRAQHGDQLAQQLASIDKKELAKMLDQLKVADVVQGKSGPGEKKRDMADHKFWATQPVRRLDEQDDDFEEGEIEPSKPCEDVRPEPYPLPGGYEWVTMDISDPSQLREVYELLTANYVEDDDAMFRFDYSAPFIEWALQPPGYIREWHIGVRVATGKRKLVAFIAGIPMTLRARDITKKSVEINFLCIHKKLRLKRLAPVLIKEVTRRCHLEGIFQAIYTAGVFLPTPISRCQYFHRNLNPPKLVATEFSAQPRGVSMARLKRSYALPPNTSLPGFREMTPEDLPSVTRLLRRYMDRFELVPEFDDQEVEHALLKGRGIGDSSQGRRKGQVVWSFVVENPDTKLITDFVSFYHLPSTAMQTTPHQTLDAAYLYLYGTTAAPSCAFLASPSSDPAPESLRGSWKDETPEERMVLKKRLVALIGDVLSVAQQGRFDVFNALTLMDNTLFVRDLLFGAGDGFLHFYLYNWKVHNIRGGCPGEPGGPQDTNNTKESGSGVGVVML